MLSRTPARVSLDSEFDSIFSVSTSMRLTKRARPVRLQVALGCDMGSHQNFLAIAEPRMRSACARAAYLYRKSTGGEDRAENQNG